MSVRVQPERTRLPGLVNSTTQSPSGTPGLATAFSMKMATCGLVQCNSLTVPSSTMNFSRSNIVVEWWAETGYAPATRPTNAALTTAFLDDDFMISPCLRDGLDYLGGSRLPPTACGIGTKMSLPCLSLSGLK